MGDTINAVALPTVVEMEEVCAVRSKARAILTNNDTILLHGKRDMIMLRYDPLLYVSSIFFVVTRMKIGTDRGAAVVLKAIGHN